MTRVKLKDGVFQPMDSLPLDWKDDMEFSVDLIESNSPGEVDEWLAEGDRLAREIDPEDEKRFLEALARIRKDAKDLASEGKR